MQRHRVDKKGRSTHIPVDKKFRDGNRPPKDLPWVWLTRDMMEAPAWCALPLIGRQALDRICLEHMTHAGKENGNLPVPHSDFIKYGVRPHSVKPALNMLIELGWVDQVSRGGIYGDLKRASRYGLTWLPRCDGTPASNRWRQIQTIGHARRIIGELRPRGQASIERKAHKIEVMKTWAA
jgi:hypothetical protein